MLSHALVIPLLSGLLALPAMANPVEASVIHVNQTLADPVLKGRLQFFSDVNCDNLIGLPITEYEVLVGAQTIVPFTPNIHALKYFNAGAGPDCLVTIWRRPDLTAAACDTSDMANLLFELPVSDMDDEWCLILVNPPNCLEMFNC